MFGTVYDKLNIFRAKLVQSLIVYEHCDCMHKVDVSCSTHAVHCIGLHRATACSAMQCKALLRPFCPYVCLSVKHVICDKTKHACAHVFTALHVMQTRYSDENSVCLSVRPSVTRVYCDKTEERSVQIFIQHER